MSFVLDASMTMSWCFANEITPYSQSILAALLSSYAEVPALWSFEVVNISAINERKKRITSLGSDEFLQTLAGLDIRIEQATPPADGKVLLPLVRRYGLSAYDAAYLELTKRRGLPLATFDKELINAAPQEGVALVGQQP
jgi:predicted nucleic acid-binding protein